MRKKTIPAIIFIISFIIFPFNNCTKKNYDEKNIFQITNNNVNFRREANLTSQILGQLNSGDQVKVVQKGEKKEKIGKWENYWYKIKTQSGIEGWIFGQFINENQ